MKTKLCPVNSRHAPIRSTDVMCQMCWNKVPKETRRALLEAMRQMKCTIDIPQHKRAVAARVIKLKGLAITAAKAPDFLPSPEKHHDQQNTKVSD